MKAYRKEYPQDPKEGDVMVWHIPEITGKIFGVAVGSVEEGEQVRELLAEYDLFLYENGLRGDYSSANGVEVFRDGEWEEYDEDLEE